MRPSASRAPGGGEAWLDGGEQGRGQGDDPGDRPLIRAGFLIGVLPGAGATIASFLAYGTEQRIAGPEKGKLFGKGSVRGLSAPETANNAAATGSFVPLLTLGIPGSGTTAIMLGALIGYGIQPGPRLYIDQPDVFWSVIISMWLGNIILLILNLPLIPYIARVLAIPARFLLPLILFFSLIGVYFVSFNTFDIQLMVLFGLAATVLRLLHFPHGADDPGLHSRRHDGRKSAPGTSDQRRQLVIPLGASADARHSRDSRALPFCADDFRLLEKPPSGQSRSDDRRLRKAWHQSYWGERRLETELFSVNPTKFRIIACFLTIFGPIGQLKQFRLNLGGREFCSRTVMLFASADWGTFLRGDDPQS